MLNYTAYDYSKAIDFIKFLYLLYCCFQTQLAYPFNRRTAEPFRASPPGG